MIKNAIAIMTSGGDSPGMNAAARAVVRTAIYEGIKVYGIHDGYDGMLKDDIVELTGRSVSDIVQRGGTFLARSSRRRKAAARAMRTSRSAASRASSSSAVTALSRAARCSRKRRASPSSACRARLTTMSGARITRSAAIRQRTRLSMPSTSSVIRHRRIAASWSSRSWVTRPAGSP